MVPRMKNKENLELLEEKIRQVDLAEIVSGKEVFVLTTNVDMQFERVFPQNSICSYQGNVGYFQCVEELYICVHLFLDIFALQMKICKQF